jgi:hypothetical protein
VLRSYRDKKVVGVFVRFRAPLHQHVHERRLKKIEALNPNIVVYAPTVEDIYEGKVLSQPFDFDGGASNGRKVQTWPF